MIKSRMLRWRNFPGLCTWTLNVVTYIFLSGSHGKITHIYTQLAACCSVAKSCLTLQPHGLQHARLPCPSLSPWVCSNSCLSMPSNLLILCCPLLILPSFPASGSPRQRSEWRDHSPRKAAAPRCWQRPGADSPLKPLEAGRPCWFPDMAQRCWVQTSGLQHCEIIHACGFSPSLAIRYTITGRSWCVSHIWVQVQTALAAMVSPQTTTIQADSAVSALSSPGCNPDFMLQEGTPAPHLISKQQTRKGKGHLWAVVWENFLETDM